MGILLLQSACTVSVIGMHGLVLQANAAACNKAVDVHPCHCELPAACCCAAGSALHTFRWPAAQSAWEQAVPQYLTTLHPPQRRLPVPSPTAGPPSAPRLLQRR